MSGNLLEFSVVTFTADALELKIKNISSNALDQALTIELYVPRYLVNKQVKDAAKAAATNPKPVGVASLANSVTCPERWSVWAKRETSDTSVVIRLLNDLDQKTGDQFSPPIKLAAGAEFTTRIPVDPQANRDVVNLLYSYQHGEQGQRVDGKLELKSGESGDWTPNVTITTNHPSPTMIKPGDLVKIFWEVKDGVSATLRGPLPGGNSELTLSPDPQADFKISNGSLEVRVVSAMTYILQAEVKHRDGKPNIQVVRMLTLDTANNKYLYLAPRPSRVLPNGLIEIDWAAWGVRRVQISVSNHTSRTIELTQQTLGRFYEGSGILRVNATKTDKESVLIEAEGLDSQNKNVQVIYWTGMGEANLQGDVVGFAVSSPRIAALTKERLYIADVGNVDPATPLQKLAFRLVTPGDPPSPNWVALTAVDQRFVCWGLDSRNADSLIVPLTNEGKRDQIPPLTLPPEIKFAASGVNSVFGFVGFGGRAYCVAEASGKRGPVRYAYSVGFDGNKASFREEPLLARLHGYRLVTFDDALYALNRQSGQMFRFELDNDGKLEAKKAASAVKKNGEAEQSMIADGLLVPVGRLLVVLNPTAVPSVASLQQFGLQNTLRYESTSSISDSIPQDLIYNPQNDRWGPCGHDLDVKQAPNVGSFAAFRGGDSMRLWVIQPDHVVQTLAVGTETLFAPNYLFDLPTKALPPYLGKTQKFTITNNTGLQLVPIRDTYRAQGLTDFRSDSLVELSSRLPDIFRTGATETFEFKYNKTDQAPIKLYLMAQQKDVVKHDYLLELTFSGPDLSTASSVFKRVARDVVSIAEIPGTTVQHSTDKPIVIPPPKLLIEGVRLRALNATSYQLWREAPEAKISNRYDGEEIKITYDTPAFYFLAWGAGQLQVDVDFSLPVDIEVSSSGQPQSKMIRINTDKSTELYAENLSTTSPASFQCKISYLRKQELNAVYIGDGVATEHGEAIYLPVAEAGIQLMRRIFKINPEDLSFTQSDPIVHMFPETGVFSATNSVVLSNEYVLAVFSVPEIRIRSYSLEGLARVELEKYRAVSGIKCHYENNFVLVGQKTNPFGARYLSRKSIAKSTTNPPTITFTDIADISLDNVKDYSETTCAIAISPSPVSPAGERIREVAIGIPGGIFVVGSSEKTIRRLALESAFREEAIVFSSDGKYIYCLHSESKEMGLRLSRVDNQTWKQTHSLSLQSGQKAPDLATEINKKLQWRIYKDHRSISMARTPDDKLLFVSHGRFIFKVDAAMMKLLGTYTTELPCRVFHVSPGKPSASSHPVYGTPGPFTLVYAMGAHYIGDGFQAKEFKTHLYKLGIPDK